MKTQPLRNLFTLLLASALAINTPPAMLLAESSTEDTGSKLLLKLIPEKDYTLINVPEAEIKAPNIPCRQ